MWWHCLQIVVGLLSCCFELHNLLDIYLSIQLTQSTIWWSAVQCKEAREGFQIGRLRPAGWPASANVAWIASNTFQDSFVPRSTLIGFDSEEPSAKAFDWSHAAP